MNDEELTAALQKAAAIVDAADLPTDLRQAAFTHLLEVQLQPIRSKKQGGRRRAKTTRQPRADTQTTTPARKTAKAGPKTFIEELAGAGFFADWKRLAEVQKALQARGRNYKQSALSPALLALTQDKVLQRSRASDDKREVWLYRKFGA